MNIAIILSSILVMALVTYLPRMLPLVVFRKKIRNRFVRSFLTYIPYGVLAAMVFPAVLYSTSHLFSALAGMLTALLLSYKNQGLLMVALGATAAVFLAELVLQYMEIL